MKAAVYARYSTDQQREASIADQLRVCERLAERHGFTVAARFQDAAISGGTASRPGYQSLLAAARRREFQVIVAEDASRLWRNSSEQAQRLAELRDLGCAVVSHDLDTRQESAAIMGAVTGAISEHYRAEIGRRTRRGLEGLALQQKPTGGKAYGYETVNGKRVINKAQAAIVRRIFTMYADGSSARAIASILNTEGIPSPGSTWNRTARRRSGWLASAISGDPSRGIGILNNEAYRGRLVWNRSRWIRSAVDGKKRRQLINPQSQWVTHSDESMRIVSDALWNSVKQRQADQSAQIGDRIRKGLSKDAANRTGRAPKYLFSGLLVCGECGSTLVISGGGLRYYACASHLNGGKAACSNNVRIRRDRVETALLIGLQDELLAPAAIKETCRQVRLAFRNQPKPSAAQRRKLESEISNLADAIAGGVLRASPALAARLRTAEEQLQRLEAAPQPAAVERLIPDLEARYKRLAGNLRETLASRDPNRARHEMSRYLGRVKVVPTPKTVEFYSEQGRPEAAMLRTVGIDRNCGSGGRI